MDVCHRLISPSPKTKLPFPRKSVSECKTLEADRLTAISHFSDTHHITFDLFGSPDRWRLLTKTTCPFHFCKCPDEMQCAKHRPQLHWKTNKIRHSFSLRHNCRLVFYLATKDYIMACGNLHWTTSDLWKVAAGRGSGYLGTDQLVMTALESAPSIFRHFPTFHPTHHIFIPHTHQYYYQRWNCQDNRVWHKVYRERNREWRSVANLNFLRTFQTWNTSANGVCKSCSYFSALHTHTHSALYRLQLHSWMDTFARRLTLRKLDTFPRKYCRGRAFCETLVVAFLVSPHSFPFPELDAVWWLGQSPKTEKCSVAFSLSFTLYVCCNCVVLIVIVVYFRGLIYANEVHTFWAVGMCEVVRVVQRSSSGGGGGQMSGSGYVVCGVMCFFFVWVLLRLKWSAECAARRRLHFVELNSINGLCYFGLAIKRQESGWMENGLFM